MDGVTPERRSMKAPIYHSPMLRRALEALRGNLSPKSICRVVCPITTRSQLPFLGKGVTKTAVSAQEQQSAAVIGVERRCGFRPLATLTKSGTFLPEDRRTT
jgi:hypothetical protein